MDEKLEQEIVEDVKLEEAPIEEIEENQESDAIDYEEKIKGLEERIAELEGKLSEEVRISERLSQMIEGSEPLDEDDDQEVVEEVSISEKFSQAQGAEATELFRANKSEILKSFNLARRR
jgi:TolA-binding protein